MESNLEHNQQISADISTIKTILIDMCVELSDLKNQVKNQIINSVSENPFSSLETTDSFKHFNDEIERNADKFKQFLQVLKKIFTNNQSEIGKCLSKYFKLVLRACFATRMINEITWSKYQRKFAVGNSRVIQAIVLSGLEVDGLTTEFDRQRSLHKEFTRVHKKDDDDLFLIDDEIDIANDVTQPDQTVNLKTPERNEVSTTHVENEMTSNSLGDLSSEVETACANQVIIPLNEHENALLCNKENQSNTLNGAVASDQNDVDFQTEVPTKLISSTPLHTKKQIWPHDECLSLASELNSEYATPNTSQLMVVPFDPRIRDKSMRKKMKQRKHQKPILVKHIDIGKTHRKFLLPKNKRILSVLDAHDLTFIKKRRKLKNWNVTRLD